MKRILIVLTYLLIFPFSGSSQMLENIDQISPFHEELAAIKKGNQWGFINPHGAIVIDYRSDLVPSKVDTGTTHYPRFGSDRCLIKQSKNGIEYYGYIDKNGKTIIEPQYLNALAFDKGFAIVLKIAKEALGTNDLLDKKVVSYSYDEIVIDPAGNIVTHLTGPEHLIFSKDKLKKRPSIKSYLLSSKLVVTKSKDNKQKIHALNTSSN